MRCTLNYITFGYKFFETIYFFYRCSVPKEVIKRARQKLRELESISPNAAATQVDGTQMSLLSVPEETSPAVEALENLDPDSLTPRQALEWIYRDRKSVV